MVRSAWDPLILTLNLKHLIEIWSYKEHALARHVCLLGGVNYPQRRMNKPLSIDDCCQEDVPIVGQYVMC